METLLRALTSSDNALRRQAETDFDSSLKQVPDQVLLELASFSAQPAADAVLRSLSFVLLRRILTRQTELWADGLAPETRNRLKATLLQALQASESLDKSLRKKLCDATSIVAVFCYDADEKWPELLQLMFLSVTTPTATTIQKENALNLFMSLAMVFHDHYQEEFPRIAGILNILASNNEPSLEVRMAAVRAAWCLVEVCNQDTEDEVVTPFKPLVGSTLDAIQAVIVAQHPRCAEPIDDLIELADSAHVRLFSKKDIERTIHMMLELASIKQKEFVKSSLGNLRLLAIELIVTLMERRSAAVRKLKPPANAAVVALLPVLIQMMAELPDLKPSALKEWGERYPSNACTSSASQHDDDADDCGPEVDFEVFGASLEYLDRMVRAIKPKHVLPLVFDSVRGLLQNKDADWRYPHTALLILAHVVEFVDRKEPELGELCRTAATLASEHPYMRVRHAAFTTLARLSYDCAPKVQKRHSQVIIGALLKGLTDPVPRVQAHAAIALINYCSATQEHEEFDVALKPYLGDVVNSLFSVLQVGQQVVQENVISALAAVARTSLDAFIPFYSSMPILKQALMSMQSPAQAVLRARLIDCIATIGKSVGKQVFLEDALWLLNVLQQIPLSTEEPDVQHIQSAWMILGEVLGEDISPFLDKVVPFTLQMANKPIDNDNDDDFENEEVDLEMQQELYKVRTAAVEDRLLALEMLCSFASNVHKGFLPFLEQTFALFHRDVRIENCSNEDVRGRVAEGLPDLVKCALGCVEQNVLPMNAFGKILTDTLEVLCVATNSEDDMDNLCILVRSISDVLSVVHDIVVTKQADACPDYVEPCASVLMQLIKDSVQRRALEFASLKCDTAEDEIDEEAQADYDAKVSEEHDLHSLLAAAFEALIKANPNSFVPAAFLSGTLANDVFDFAHHVRLCHDQRVAVFILVDVVEFAAKHTITPELLKRISDQLLVAAQVVKSTSPTEPSYEVAGLVQAAVYGFGVLGERFGDMWPQAKDAVQIMVTILKNAPKSLRDGDGAEATCLDNCASSLLKIARACPHQLQNSQYDQAAVLSVWLDYMPLLGDMFESRLNSFALIRMLEEGSAPSLLQPQTLPSLVRVFASIIGTDCLDDRHIDRALNILQRLKTEMGDDAFNQSVNLVPKDQLENLAARIAYRA